MTERESLEQIASAASTAGIEEGFASLRAACARVGKSIVLRREQNGGAAIEVVRPMLSKAGDIVRFDRKSWGER